MGDAHSSFPALAVPLASCVTVGNPLYALCLSFSIRKMEMLTVVPVL